MVRTHGRDLMSTPQQRTPFPSSSLTRSALLLSALMSKDIHLVTARDLVQQIHIQAPHANGPQDIEKYDLFLESVTRAWKCTTEVYSNIFATLANVTGPDVTVGRKGRDDYLVFKTMADTAANAKRVVAGYAIRRTKNTPYTMHDETGDLDCEEENPRMPTVPGHREDHVAKNRKRAPSVVDSVPLQHRPPKMLKLAEMGAQPKVLQSANGRDQQSEGVEQPAKPKVEYEDVSNEISARLKAKEERKKAKRDTKKRKRESNDSFIEPEISLHDARKPEKPQRKKSRGEENFLKGEPKAMEMRSKRKKSVSTISSQDNKKRKTKI